MLRLINGIFLLFILATTTFCATTPKRAGKVTDVGVWQGRVMLNEGKNNNNRKWANVTWASDSANNRMRVDVYAVMDFPLATFLTEQENNKLWLFQEKKMYESADGKKLFYRLTKLSLEPQFFFSLLGNPKTPSPAWECRTKETTFLCDSRTGTDRLSVDFSDPDKRIIKIVGRGKALRLRLSRSKVQVEDRHFKALSTSHFKTIKI